MSALASEGCLLFLYNKTLDWLLKKPVEERDRLIRCCQRQTPQMKATFAERQRKLQMELAARLQQQQQEKADKEAKELREKTALVGRVENVGGLWTTSVQMEDALQKLKRENRGEAKGKCADALKLQIAYRKKILQQPSQSPKDFSFSENGRALNEDELKAKVQTLMDRCSVIVNVNV